MVQGIQQSNRFPQSERMCKDVRSMQLFAEQVLAYRLQKPAAAFRSFGFHEPNTDEGRQVYTIVDDRIYYFLPQLTRDYVHRAFHHLQAFICENAGTHSDIRQIVIVGESSTTTDRAQLQEAINNYQFSTVEPDAPGQTEPSSTNHPAFPHDLNQVTLLPSANSQPLTIRRNLSYINEDPYWDPRQDNLSSSTDGILQDRASAITAWLRQQPEQQQQPQIAANATNVHPTKLQSPNTEIQAAQVVDPIMGDPQPVRYASPQTDHNRDNDTSETKSHWLSDRFGGLANNLAFLLACIGLLSGIIWLMQGGLNQLLNPDNTPNKIQTNPAPPPPPTGSQPLNSETTSSQAMGTPQGIGSSTEPSSVTDSSRTNPSSTTPTTTPSQPTQPVPGFFVRTSPNYDGVNLRVGPGTENRKIRGIPDGYWVVDEGRQIGDWREVSFQAQRGWVYRPFIR